MIASQTINYANGNTHFYYKFDLSILSKINKIDKFFIITDSHLMDLYRDIVTQFEHVILFPGEASKNIVSYEYIIAQMIEKKVDRSWTVIGFGGGVITDMSGYVASTYMRGINFVSIPTTILGMVDAAIGGKNGIDVGAYKNILGCFKQPNAIIIDTIWLHSLPMLQWQNGFAEIIKHACIQDENLFNFLFEKDINFFKNNEGELKALIKKNIDIKNNIVLQDVFEKKERKYLNFGHTFGHAIENEMQLLHGEAISKGIVIAAALSVHYKLIRKVDYERIILLLDKYNLPTNTNDINFKLALDILFMDKKRTDNNISFILLNKIGEAVIKEIEIEQLIKIINDGYKN